jgi:hypothetical protein
MSDPQWQQPPNPYYTPPGYRSPTPTPPPASAGHRRSASRRAVWIVPLITLIVGAVGGYFIGHSTTSASKHTAAAVTAAASTDPATTEDPVSSAPDDESSTTPNLAPSDFTIKLRIKSKECFGSAGCDLTYQINPQYNGVEDISSGTWEVTYEVRGGQDGPQVNTFTLDNGQASFDDSESIQTASSGTKLRAKVTSVEVQS